MLFWTGKVHRRLWLDATLTLLVLGLVLVGCGFTPQEENDEEQVPTIVSEVLTQVASNEPTSTPAPPATITAEAPPPTSTLAPSVTPTETEVPSETPLPASETPLPTPTETVTMAPTSDTDLAILDNRFFIYPNQSIFNGDLVTVQFVARVPAEIDRRSIGIEIWVDGAPVHSAIGLQSQNLGGDFIGIFPWVWDSTDQIGARTIEVRLDPADNFQIGDEDPNNNIVRRTIDVLPRSEMKTVEVDQQWITRETDYAYIHVVSGTAAARDLDRLAAMTDEAIILAANTLEETPVRKFDVFFIDRVIGQGGYAAGSMVVSYLDRNYSGGSLLEVLEHEAIHVMDWQFVNGARLPFLAEGVAVWAAGGHYKPENLQGRARALVDSGLYIPLDQLINDFYPVQHEIGYLEAGAFFEYLVNTYGWFTAKAFYANVYLGGEPSYSSAVNTSAVTHFGLTLEQLEADWLASLDMLPYDRTQLTDVNSTIRYYEVMRFYQLNYDPTAYFRIAWLPNPQELLQRGITADLTRHPETVTNLTLEVMLTEADAALRSGDYRTAEVLISSVDRILLNGGAFNDPQAQSYREIVATVTEWGFEVQRISLEGTTARIQVTNPFEPNLIELNLARDGSGWVLIN